MNKLIIVGNGFDIHNGLPTKYSDFLRWLIKKAIYADEEEYLLNHLIKIETIELVNQYVTKATVIKSKEDIIEIFLDFENGYPQR